MCIARVKNCYGLRNLSKNHSMEHAFRRMSSLPASVHPSGVSSCFIKFSFTYLFIPVYDEIYLSIYLLKLNLYFTNIHWINRISQNVDFIFRKEHNELCGRFFVVCEPKMFIISGYMPPYKGGGVILAVGFCHKLQGVAWWTFVFWQRRLIKHLSLK